MVWWETTRAMWGTVLSFVLVASAITWTLRAVPFALLAPLGHSELIRFLGDQSPVGVSYTFRDVVWLDPAITLPILISGAITAGLQLRRSNLVLSLAGGTAVHIALATTIAGGLGG